MPIKLKTVVGTALTHAEVDTNFSSLFYSASISGSFLVLHTTGSSVQAATTAPINVGLGNQTTASGIFSNAQGFNTIASGSYQHAQGQYNISSSAQSAFIIGNGTSTSARSNLIFASGSEVQITGSLRVSGSIVGSLSGSITGSLFGSASHASTSSYINPLNQSVIITGSLSQGAAGNIISGIPSHAEGTGTQAIGESAHAEGAATVASGVASHAEGGNATSQGNYSHAEGYFTNTGTTEAHLANSIISGIVTLPSSYGNITSSFPARTYIHADDTNFNGDFGTAIFKIQSSTYSAPNTLITLENYSDTSQCYIVNVSLARSLWNGNEPYNGESAHVEGYNTLAIGQYSHAEGNSTTAIGTNSHAEGFATTAAAVSSHAEGISTQAIGDYSHAEGFYARALGFASHVEGYYTSASGTAAHAEGSGTQAIGTAAHAEGIRAEAGTTKAYLASSVTTGVIILPSSYGNIASSFTAGSSILVDDNDFAGNLGRVTVQVASSTYSAPNTLITPVVIESDTDQCYVVNISTFAYSWSGGYVYGGAYSHAEGWYTTALGSGCHAEGVYAQATADYCHAEGQYTKAVGVGSHAEGSNTTAIGTNSHAEGNQTTASGVASHAEGFGTIAQGSYQHAQGQYNISTSAQSAFIIGNGTSTSARSNLIFASGSQVQITGSLIVTGSVNINHLLQLASRTTTPTLTSANAGTLFVSGASATTGSLYFYDGANIRKLV